LKNSSSFESEIETGIELGKAMQALTERERKIIIAHTKDDLTFKRIGDMIGVSESQISRIYSKAIKTLKVELSK